MPSGVASDQASAVAGQVVVAEGRRPGEGDGATGESDVVGLAEAVTQGEAFGDDQSEAGIEAPEGEVVVDPVDEEVFVEVADVSQRRDRDELAGLDGRPATRLVREAGDVLGSDDADAQSVLLRLRPGVEQAGDVAARDLGVLVNRQDRDGAVGREGAADAGVERRGDSSVRVVAQDVGTSLGGGVERLLAGGLPSSTTTTWVTWGTRPATSSSRLGPGRYAGTTATTAGGSASGSGSVTPAPPRRPRRPGRASRPSTRGCAAARGAPRRGRRAAR